MKCKWSREIACNFYSATSISLVVSCNSPFIWFSISWDLCVSEHPCLERTDTCGCHCLRPVSSGIEDLEWSYWRSALGCPSLAPISLPFFLRQRFQTCRYSLSSSHSYWVLLPSENQRRIFIEWEYFCPSWWPILPVFTALDSFSLFFLYILIITALSS